MNNLSANLQHRENSFEELAKCSETFPELRFYKIPQIFSPDLGKIFSPDLMKNHIRIGRNHIPFRYKDFRIPIIKIRRSHGRLIFIMGIMESHVYILSQFKDQLHFFRHISAEVELVWPEAIDIIRDILCIIYRRWLGCWTDWLTNPLEYENLTRPKSRLQIARYIFVSRSVYVIPVRSLYSSDTQTTARALALAHAHNVAGINTFGVIMSLIC